MKNVNPPDFDTIAVWRAARQNRSQDLRVWLGEIPTKGEVPPAYSRGQAQPIWRGRGEGALVKIIKTRAI